MGVREKSIWSMIYEKILEPTHNLTYANQGDLSDGPKSKHFIETQGRSVGETNSRSCWWGEHGGSMSLFAQTSKPQQFYCCEIHVHTVITALIIIGKIRNNVNIYRTLLK